MKIVAHSFTYLREYLLFRPLCHTEAKETLMEVMRSGKSERIRGTAAQVLLDRGWDAEARNHKRGFSKLYRRSGGCS